MASKDGNARDDTGDNARVAQFVYMGFDVWVASKSTITLAPSSSQLPCLIIKSFDRKQETLFVSSEREIKVWHL